MIRLFVALPIPDDLRARIAGLQGGIDGARWVAPENLHITLRFIGEVPEDRLEDIVAALDRVHPPSLTIEPGDTGRFGTGDKARAIWVGVRKSPEIETLHQVVDHALVRTGLPPEGRKYTPHITVARLRGARGGRVANWLEATAGFFATPFDARAFVLYESRMGRGGPVYDPVSEFPLS
jgi:2'-5' RNA ligase